MFHVHTVHVRDDTVLLRRGSQCSRPKCSACGSQWCVNPAAASGGGGHAVVDVDEIIKKATEEVKKNNVIDMLKLSLNEMKQDERLFQYIQKKNADGSFQTKKDPKTKRSVPDTEKSI